MFEDSLVRITSPFLYTHLDEESRRCVDGVTGSAIFFCLAEALASAATTPTAPTPATFTPGSFLCLSSKHLQYFISLVLSPDQSLDRDVNRLKSVNFFSNPSSLQYLCQTLLPICHLALLIGLLNTSLALSPLTLECLQLLCYHTGLPFSGISSWEKMFIFISGILQFQDF